MKVLHIFTEEPSAKNVFEIILPKILPIGAYFRVYHHQGKQDLEKAIKTTVPSISKTPGARILITRDQDSSDCLIIKNKINDLIKDGCKSPYRIRIICKELESWFLGDLNSIAQAYPRFIPEQYVNKAELRDVDSIISPNLFLLNIIPEFNDRKTLPKLQTADSISPFMTINGNKSSSFNQTILAINALIED